MQQPPPRVILTQSEGRCVVLADRARWSIAGIEIILGAAAVFGGYSLLSDADALGAKQEWLDGSLFPDYTIPGLFLLVVIGAGSLLAASVTVLAPRYASLTAGALAAVLAAWGIVEDRHGRLARMATARTAVGVRRRAGPRARCLQREAAAPMSAR